MKNINVSFVSSFSGASRMAGTLVTRWRNCSRRRRDIAARMKPPVHRPRAHSTTRATCPKCPITKAPAFILRRVTASKLATKCFPTASFTGAASRPEKLSLTSSRPRTAYKKAPLPVTTTVTRRILRATKMTAGEFMTFDVILHLLLEPIRRYFQKWKFAWLIDHWLISNWRIRKNALF